jgi:hypothetical protein
MRTVLTHFWNEELLLPYWISHHRRLFDYGILIDNGSTDRSAQICRELAPDWLVLPSKFPDFDSILMDHEVMQYESCLRGFKICLNVSEFLLTAKPLEQIETDLIRESNGGPTGKFTSAAIMVDTCPSDPPFNERVPLFLQKSTGILETPDNKELRASLELPLLSRGRFYHNFPIGGYRPGRHSSEFSQGGPPCSDLLVLWFGYSPWSQPFIDRKLAIGPRVSDVDRRFSRGWHHTNETRELLVARQNRMANHSAPLLLLPQFQFALDDFLSTKPYGSKREASNRSAKAIQTTATVQ